MANKPVDPNAKLALNQMKLEIANELGMQANNQFGANETSYYNGEMGGNLGGLMSRALVQMGEEILLREYNGKK